MSPKNKTESIEQAIGLELFLLRFHPVDTNYHQANLGFSIVPARIALDNEESSMDPQSVQRLKENLGKAQKQFDEWARQQILSVEASKQDYVERSISMRQHAGSLRKQEKEFVDTADRLVQQLEAEKQEIDVIKSGIEQLRLREKALPGESFILQKQIVKERSQVDNYQAAMTNNVNEFSAKERDAKKICNMYRNLLGLRFETTEEGLRFVFTYIDPKDWNREFTFTLKLESNPETYQVVGCEPEIPNAAKYAQRLNETYLPDNEDINSFSLFVVSMRNEFKKTCQS